MKLPPLVYALGFAGLLPFLAGPCVWTFFPDAGPAWLEHAWLSYGALIAAFMAGTFWGFALPAVQGAEGFLGLLIASVLLVLTWVSMMLPVRGALIGLGGVFLLLLLADFWRERTLDTIPGYFLLRGLLTAGVLVAISWKLVL